MDVTDGDNTRVVYTTKELLNRQDAKLDIIIAKMDTKADKSDLLALLTRIAVVENYQERAALTEVQRNQPAIARGEKYMEYVDILRQTAADKKTVDGLVQNAVTTDALHAFKKYLVGAVITGVGSALGVVGFFLTHFGRGH